MKSPCGSGVGLYEVTVDNRRLFVAAYQGQGPLNILYSCPLRPAEQSECQYESPLLTHADLSMPTSALNVQMPEVDAK